MQVKSFNTSVFFSFSFLSLPPICALFWHLFFLSHFLSISQHWSSYGFVRQNNRFCRAFYHLCQNQVLNQNQDPSRFFKNRTRHIPHQASVYSKTQTHRGQNQITLFWLTKWVRLSKYGTRFSTDSTICQQTYCFQQGFFFW